MGYQEAKAEYHVYALLNRHNTEQDDIDNQLWDELSERCYEAIQSIVDEPKYKAIKANLV
jgi:hypothetical protein